nr:MAG TPA: hypothetical protein [Caudoviricetes sp.]
MRNRISKWLIKLADKINPQERLSSIERVNNYEAKKLGICLGRTKKEIKDYRKKMKLDEGWSNRKADEMLVMEVKNEVRQSIINSINQRGLIEYSVEKVGDELHVTGEIKVYIKKESHESSNR